MNKTPQPIWATLAEDLPSFESRIYTALETLGVRSVCDALNIDHICIRLKDSAKVDMLRQELRELGTEISSVMVNGRIISIFELHMPIAIGPWRASGIEVPYPKLNHRYEDGWEHVEFVVGGIENTMEALRTSFASYFPHLASTDLMRDFSYEEDEPSAPDDQIRNPTISLKVHGIGIKFHARPIQEVVGHVSA